MPTISPTNDLAVKKVLGSVENTDILAGLISDIFGIVPDELTIENPYSIKDYEAFTSDGSDYKLLRQTLTDVSASMKSAQFTAEIQIRKQRFYDERAMYYACDRYCRQYSVEGALERSRRENRPVRFSSLVPVYALNILGYSHFDDDDALRIFVPYDPVRRKSYDKGMLSIAFFELTKRDIETENQRHWRDYFTGGKVSEDAPAYIRKASEVIDYANLSREEQKMAMNVEKAQAIFDAVLNTSYLDGRDEGEAKGQAQAMLQMAKRLKNRGMSIDEIAEITLLSPDDLRELFNRADGA